MRRYTLKSTQPAPERPGFLDDLNEEQRQVAEALSGPMLVIAGAGTGKTRTLVYRTAHIIETRVDPGRIMLLTFTNRAAREMTDRVQRLVPVVTERMWAGTFHHVGHRILRRYAERLGYGTNFGIINPQEGRDLMTAVIGETVAGVSGKRFPKADVLLGILSSALNTDRPLSVVLDADFPRFADLQPQIDKVLTAYLTRKVEMNLMDYDDLLVNWRLLLEDHEDVRAQYTEHFQHIMVDEYQDTNALQASVIKLMLGAHQNLMVVGDDCQSIYGWRGADVANILSFPEQFEGCQIFKLQTNYRCTPQIIDLANTSIAQNRRRFDKTLTSACGDGELPAFVALADGAQQAAFVAQRALELRDEGVDLNNQAVLYRAHYQAMELQLELQRRGIPFVIRSGLRFFEQAHIRDLLAHLRILHNPRDQLAWMRVLKMREGIGNNLAVRIVSALTAQGDPMAALHSGINVQLPSRARKSFEGVRGLLLRLDKPAMIRNPAAMFDEILGAGLESRLQDGAPNAEQRVEDIKQLGHFAAQYTDYRDFLNELSLVENLSAEQVVAGGDTDERLLLSTVHQAKGLEWDAVFMLDMADGRFPLARALQSQEQEEEERRLFYVATTRARRDLYLCYPQWGIDRDRTRIFMRPSRFLTEIDASKGARTEVWQISESPV
ncbi:MAG: ATP-dependent helicase [Bradymonadia bacterium]